MEGTLKVEEGEVKLEIIRRYVATILHDYPFMANTSEIIIRDAFERMGKELIAFTDLPLEKLKTVEDTATFRTPKTWFQHLKESHFPKWLKNKFLTKWHEEKIKVILEVGAVYPQLPEAYPKGTGEIRYRYYKNTPTSVYPS